jgi:hypothetical protein
VFEALVDIPLDTYHSYSDPSITLNGAATTFIMLHGLVHDVHGDPNAVMTFMLFDGHDLTGPGEMSISLTDTCTEDGKLKQDDIIQVTFDQYMDKISTAAALLQAFLNIPAFATQIAPSSVDDDTTEQGAYDLSVAGAYYTTHLGRITAPGSSAIQPDQLDTDVGFIDCLGTDVHDVWPSDDACKSFSFRIRQATPTSTSITLGAATLNFGVGSVSNRYGIHHSVALTAPISDLSVAPRLLIVAEMF